MPTASFSRSGGVGPREPNNRFSMRSYLEMSGWGPEYLDESNRMASVDLFFFRPHVVPHRDSGRSPYRKRIPLAKLIKPGMRIEFSPRLKADPEFIGFVEKRVLGKYDLAIDSFPFGRPLQVKQCRMQECDFVDPNSPTLWPWTVSYVFVTFVDDVFVHLEKPHRDIAVAGPPIWMTLVFLAVIAFAIYISI